MFQRSVLHQVPPQATFRLEAAPGGASGLALLAAPPGSRAAPRALWQCRFDSPEDRAALLEAAEGGELDLAFLGHLTMAFGPAALDQLTTELVAAASGARRAAADKAAELARQHLIVALHARDLKRGFALELKRRSRDEADWRVVYDRAAERDRLCDWLRWQKPRFLAFLDEAERHGGEALTRLLTDEMFEAERRVKKEGRGAGGLRPLRMWRGD